MRVSEGPALHSHPAGRGTRRHSDHAARQGPLSHRANTRIVRRMEFGKSLGNSSLAREETSDEGCGNIAKRIVRRKVDHCLSTRRARRLGGLRHARVLKAGASRELHRDQQPPARPAQPGRGRGEPSAALTSTCVFEQTKDLLGTHGIPWYRTDENGRITITTRGTVGGGYSVSVVTGGGKTDDVSLDADCESL